MIKVPHIFAFINSRMFKTAICLLLCGSIAIQAEAKSRSEMRAIYLKKLPDSKLSNSLKQLTIKLLKDRSVPINEISVVNLAKKHPMTTEQKQKIGIYLSVWMLRHFDQPKEILSFYKSLPYPWGRYLLNQLVLYNQVIDIRYTKLASRSFRDALNYYCTSQLGVNNLYTNSGQLIIPLQFLLLAQKADAIPIIKKTLLYKIGDWTVRSNMLSTVINMEGKAAMPLAVKYFKRYAYRPEEIKLLLNYFYKYNTSIDIAELISFKKQQLKKSLDALPYKRNSKIENIDKNKAKNKINYGNTNDIASNSLSKLVVDKTQYNFGKHNSTGSIQHTFVLHNKGKQPIHLGKITTSCGCTVAHAPSNKVIAPGENAKINVTVDLTNKSGYVHEVVMVKEGTSANAPVLRLYITGNVTTK